MKVYTEQELKHHVSRMAAALVLAAGGEIKLPRDILRDVDRIELEQVDRPGIPGIAVIYRARRTDFRRSGGDVVEGEVVRRQDGAAGMIIDTKALPAPGDNH